jgi:hypothetical protein
MANDADTDRGAARDDLERDLLAVLPAPPAPKKVAEAG